MIWLPEARDRRLQYYIHYLQSWARLSSAIYFYYINVINTYDAFFTVYLVTGADATGRDTSKEIIRFADGFSFV